MSLGIRPSESGNESGNRLSESGNYSGNESGYVSEESWWVGLTHVSHGTSIGYTRRNE